MDTDIDQAESEVLKSTAAQYGAVLYEWDSFSDFATEKNLNWTAAMLLFEVLFILIAVLTQQWLLVVILVGIAALTYLLSRYPLKKNHNVITTLGVILNNKLLKWSELEAFWILQEPIHLVLGFETRRRFNKDEMVLIDREDPMQLVEIISKYLPQKEKEIPLVDVMLEFIGFKLRSLLGKVFKRQT